jgi:putative ABC transport system substrate-binding protein
VKRRAFIAGLGGAAAWPLGARAQQPERIYRIGGLNILPRTAPHILALFDELRQVGFVEGQNLVVVGAWAYRPEQFPEMASELVKAKADVILCGGDSATRAAQQATKRIPILAVADDLVGSGLAPSLAHQGGNSTGVSILASELDVKRLEILHEFVPRALRIAVMADPSTISTRAQLVRAARDLGLELVWFEAQSADEMVRAFDAIALARIEAVNVLASPLLNQQRRIMRGAASPPGHLPMARNRRRRWLPRLWPAFHSSLSADGREAARQAVARHETGRPSHRATDQVRACDQSEDR